MITAINRNSCAYKEIYEILKLMPLELVNKIPKEKINFFYNNMDKEYEYNVTKENLGLLPMLEETSAIFTILFRDYWATKEQAEKINKFEKNERKKHGEEIREKYNPNNLFKQREINKVEEVKEQSITIYKTSIYTKIINRLREIFKR